MTPYFKQQLGIEPDVGLWRVAAFWSSSKPAKAVPWLCVGLEEIRRAEKHPGFICWLTPGEGRCHGR